MRTAPSPQSHFDQLLQAAAAQAEPQRLLFVFATSELPPDASPAQRSAHAAGQGGMLAPLACVDKRPGELSTFAALVEESRAVCPPWQLAFVAALGGRAGAEPTETQVNAALQSMVEGVRDGRLGGYLALDASGEPVSFSQAGAA